MQKILKLCKPIEKMKPKFKSWHTCKKCAEKQGLKREQAGCITVMEGKCPDCGEKATLIPLVDFDGNYFD